MAAPAAPQNVTSALAVPPNESPDTGCPLSQSLRPRQIVIGLGSNHASPTCCWRPPPAPPA
jgi:hypothetical protein